MRALLLSLFLPLTSFKTFLFISGFKQFDYDGQWYSFLHFLCLQFVELLRSVGLQLSQNLKIFGPYFLNSFFCPSLRHSLINNMFIVRLFEILPKLPDTIFIYFSFFYYALF